MRTKYKKENHICKTMNKVILLITLFFLTCGKVDIYVNAAMITNSSNSTNSTNVPTTTTTSAANKIAESTFGTGLKNFLNDASAFLLILSPIIGGLFALYFFARKNAADEQDQKQWNKRLMTTGICVVGAVLVSSMINVFTGYFK